MCLNPPRFPFSGVNHFATVVAIESVTKIPYAASIETPRIQLALQDVNVSKSHYLLAWHAEP